MACEHCDSCRVFESLNDQLNPVLAHKMASAELCGTVPDAQASAKILSTLMTMVKGIMRAVARSLKDRT